jgi:hypothetical protein
MWQSQKPSGFNYYPGNQISSCDRLSKKQILVIPCVFSLLRTHVFDPSISPKNGLVEGASQNLPKGLSKSRAIKWCSRRPLHRAARRNLFKFLKVTVCLKGCFCALAGGYNNLFFRNVRDVSSRKQTRNRCLAGTTHLNLSHLVELEHISCQV